MDRRSVIKHAGIAGVLAAGAAPAVHAQAVVRWRLTSAFPKALDTIFGAADVFSKQVKAMSGGKFEISVHPSGELVGGFGQVDALQNGTVEMAHTAPYYYFGKDPTFALGCAIPFGFNSRQMTAWYQEGNGQKLMREFYNNFNIISFIGGNTGAQMGGWFRKEIKSVADIKGLKFRTGGFSGVIWEKIGGVAQSIPGGEIYTALEKGTIDAAEWVGPYDDEKLGFNKVAPFYAYPVTGKAARSWTSSSTPKRTTRCRPRTRPSSRPRPPWLLWTCRPSTMPATRPRSSAWWLAAPSCSASPRR